MWEGLGADGWVVRFCIAEVDYGKGEVALMESVSSAPCIGFRVGYRAFKALTDKISLDWLIRGMLDARSSDSFDRAIAAQEAT